MNYKGVFTKEIGKGVVLFDLFLNVIFQIIAWRLSLILTMPNLRQKWWVVRASSIKFLYLRKLVLR